MVIGIDDEIVLIRSHIIDALLEVHVFWGERAILLLFPEARISLCLNKGGIIDIGRHFGSFKRVDVIHLDMGAKEDGGKRREKIPNLI